VSQATLDLKGRNPDVLTCIANLSNDEVFTPPEFANRMLDTLETAWASSNDGASIWTDPTVTFLDPFTKSGIFLREIASRLTAGLATAIPDLGERVDHILTNQVFGIGHHLHPHLARVHLPRHRHRLLLEEGRRLGDRRPHAHRTRCPGPEQRGGDHADRTRRCLPLGPRIGLHIGGLPCPRDPSWNALLDGQNRCVLGVNAMAESFFSALKNERVYRTVYATKAQAKRDIIAYIEGFYNSRRRHSALGYRRPNEVHYSYQQPALAA